MLASQYMLCMRHRKKKDCGKKEKQIKKERNQIQECE